MIRNDKLEARQIFLFHFKGTPSQDQQKPFRRRLITFKVTYHYQYYLQILTENDWSIVTCMALEEVMESDWVDIAAMRSL